MCIGRLRSSIDAIRTIFSPSVAARAVDQSGVKKLSEPARTKVLLIGPLPPPTAGVEALTLGLLRHLETGPWSVRNIDTQKRLVPVSLRGRLSLINLLYACRDVARLLAELALHRPDIAHSPFSSTATGSLRDSLLIGICRLFGVPIVAHVHGGDFDRLLARGPAPIAGVCRAALRSSARVVVLSTYWKELIESHFSGIECTIVPNGSEDLGPPPARDREVPVRILHVGAQGRRKGVHELLDAVAGLRREGHDLRLTLLGAEEWVGEGKAIESAIDRLELGAIVTRTGQLENESRRPHFDAADIFCLPSHHEGAPVALLEAMSAGLPVVVSAVGAMPETVGAGGRTVPPGNAGALADALRPLILDGSLRRRWGEANRREWEQKHGVEHHLARITRVIGECVP
ncbi:MAG: hypothetical protein CME06_04535 [Gemmatimonadetes bacterium]|nr:hypothetical protein [Gemmatimonadota bacterium]